MAGSQVVEFSGKSTNWTGKMPVLLVLQNFPEVAEGYGRLTGDGWKVGRWESFAVAKGWMAVGGFKAHHRTAPQNKFQFANRFHWKLR